MASPVKNEQAKAPASPSSAMPPIAKHIAAKAAQARQKSLKKHTLLVVIPKLC